MREDTKRCWRLIASFAAITIIYALVTYFAIPHLWTPIVGRFTDYSQMVFFFGVGVFSARREFLR